MKAYPTKRDLQEALKTYATKEDLTSGLQILRQEMKELSSEDRRHASVLFERTQEQFEIIAAHLADISQRVPPRRQGGQGA